MKALRPERKEEKRGKTKKKTIKQKKEKKKKITRTKKGKQMSFLATRGFMRPLSQQAGVLI